MRELLAAKANVDQLTGYGEERQNDREKEQGQEWIKEATECDFKVAVERKKPKSWLKSVSAFSNGIGGTLFFGTNVVPLYSHRIRIFSTTSRLRFCGYRCT